MASRFDAFLSGKAPQEPAQGATVAGSAPDQASDQAPSGGVSGYVPPILQAVGAGGVQGLRDIAQTATGLTSKIGIGTGWNQDLAAQTQAFRDKYGSSWPAWLAEQAAGIAATAPLTGGLGGLAGGAVRAAVPWAARVLGPAVEGAIAGGGTNALMSGGQNENPLTAAATGALGGGIIGGGLGALAGVGAGSAGNQLAQRLGFDLSAGERMGGVARGIEDVTKWAPGSGAAAKNAEHTQRISQILGDNIGIGPVDNIDLPEMSQAKTNAGRLMDQVQHIPVDANNDPNLLNELSNTFSSAQMSAKAAPQGVINHIMQIAANNNGILPGNEIHNLISRGGVVDLLTGSNDRAEAFLGSQIKDSLLDAAQRSSAGNPAFANFQQGRAYWKAIKTIENSVVQNPDGSAGMSWQGLKRAIFNNYDMNQTGPGNEMQDLARVLHGPLKALPESGTGRQNFFSKLLVPGAHAGEAAGIGALAYLNPSYVANVAAPTAAAGMLGRAMRFGPDMGTGAAWAPWRAYRSFTNPLMPRAAGPMVGNMLTGGGQQQGPAQ